MSTLNDQGLPKDYNFKAEYEVTPRDVKKMLDEEADFVLLDCRTNDERELVKIDGDHEFIPIQEIEGRVDELTEYKDKKVITYCHAGGRSMRMTLALRQIGFKDAWSMAGGIDLWATDIEPDKPRY